MNRKKSINPLWRDFDKCGKISGETGKTFLIVTFKIYAVYFEKTSLTNLCSSIDKQWTFDAPSEVASTGLLFLTVSLLREHFSRSNFLSLTLRRIKRNNVIVQSSKSIRH